MKVFDLAFAPEYYYIKRNAIVEKITFNNRTFYAKFERIDEALTPLIVKQHFHREYTIAVPLVQNNTTRYLLIEYKGQEYQRFYHLIKHLFKTLHIEKYHIYEGKDAERLQVFIDVGELHLKEAEAQLHTLSNALSQKMVKKWKCLPLTSLPNAYNVVVLPYKKI